MYKELYIMAVMNNMQIKSYFIYDVKNCSDIYNYFENKYNKKILLYHQNNIPLYKDNLEKIVNKKDSSLFLRVFI
tara:strand:- start:3034 stop:3258 length:225 start_codon:yes stop_codon:yes gene_type:complete